MTDYFQEMGWQPLGEGQEPDHLLHFARLLRDFNIFDESLSNSLPPPASKREVENLKEITISNSGEKCSVCLKEFDISGLAKQMPCTHIFHKECIVPWLSKTNSCPLCRHELTTDNEDYEAYKKEKLREKDRKNDIEILHNSMFS